MREEKCGCDVRAGQSIINKSLDPFQSNFSEMKDQLMIIEQGRTKPNK